MSRRQENSDRVTKLTEILFDLCPPESSQPVILQARTIAEAWLDGWSGSNRSGWKLIEKYMDQVQGSLDQDYDIHAVRISNVGWNYTDFVVPNPMADENSPKWKRAATYRGRLTAFTNTWDRIRSHQRKIGTLVLPTGKQVRLNFPEDASNEDRVPITISREVANSMARKMLPCRGHATAGIALHLPGEVSPLAGAKLGRRVQAHNTTGRNLIADRNKAVERELVVEGSLEIGNVRGNGQRLLTD